MSHAQKVYRMGIRLVQVFRDEGIKMRLEDRLKLYAKLERWCVQAQLKEGN